MWEWAVTHSAEWLRFKVWAAITVVSSHSWKELVTKHTQLAIVDEDSIIASSMGDICCFHLLSSYSLSSNDMHTTPTILSPHTSLMARSKHCSMHHARSTPNKFIGMNIGHCSGAGNARTSDRVHSLPCRHIWVRKRLGWSQYCKPQLQQAGCIQVEY